MLKVALRGGFADRMGLNPENTIIQIDSLDERARTAMINCLGMLFQCAFTQESILLNSRNDVENIFAKNILMNVYQQQVDFSRKKSIQESVTSCGKISKGL